MSKTDDQIRSDISRFEYRSDLGGWLVIVGLVLEVCFVGAKSLGYEMPPNTENWSAVLADSLIALGVVIEIRFGRKANEGHAELRSRADERAAKLEKEAAKARERVAEIELLTGWRHIPPEQSDEIVAALSGSMSDIHLLIEYQYSDAEAWSYSVEIATLFGKAGVASIRRMANSHLGHIVFGVHIAGAPNVDVMRIVGEFTKASIPAHSTEGMDLSTHLPRNELAPNLYIFVGPKPPPMLTEWDAMTMHRPTSSETRE